MNKTMNVGINEEEYKKFCEEHGLNPEHKLSRIRFASTKDDDVKALLKGIEEGEVDLDDIEMLEVNPKEMKKDFTKGLKMLFEGIAYLTANKEKLEGHPFYDLDEDAKSKIGLALMNAWGEDLIRLSDCITQASVMFGFTNYMKGKKKDDKKA